MTIVY